MSSKDKWSELRPLAGGAVVIAALFIGLSRPYRSAWLGGSGGPSEPPRRRWTPPAGSEGSAAPASADAPASPALAPPEPALVKALKTSYSGGPSYGGDEAREAVADAVAGGGVPRGGGMSAGALSGVPEGASSGARAALAGGAAAAQANAGGGGAASSSRAAAPAAAGASTASAPANAASAGKRGGASVASSGGAISGGGSSPLAAGGAAGGAGPAAAAGGPGGGSRAMSGSGGGGGGTGDAGNGGFSPGGLDSAKGGAAPPDVKTAAGGGGGGGSGGAGGGGGSPASSGAGDGGGVAAPSGDAGGGGSSAPSPFMAMGGAGGQEKQPPPVEAVKPEDGVPQPGAVVGQKMFRRKKGEPPTIAMETVAAPNGTLYRWNSKMSIDADGAGDACKVDRTGQCRTSLRYKDGTSLDPTKIPFCVKAGDQDEVHLGDYCAVSYKGKTVYGIVADVGPKGVLGECSMACARALGINSDPNKGGVESGVQYLVIPGTRDAEPPRSAQAIQERGKALLSKAGVDLASNQ